MKNKSDLDIKDIERRFGLVEKNYRIGSLNLKAAQIDRVDEIVCELYPDAVALHGDAPVWMITWPAAFGLAEYLLHNKKLSGAAVLELGCGTAFPGIALEKTGAHVISTDYDSNALALAAYNAERNRCSSIQFSRLDWYKPEMEGSFDLVIGSDVVYFEKNFLPLISVMKRYTAPGGEIIISDQGRPQMKVFLKKCEEAGFSYSEKRQNVYLPDETMIIRIITIMPSPPAPLPK